MSSGRFSPKLPDVPYEVDDEEGLSIKLVRLVKGSEPLGATIKCDAHGAVYIARVIAGGVADRSACIQVTVYFNNFFAINSRKSVTVFVVDRYLTY